MAGDNEYLRLIESKGHSMPSFVDCCPLEQWQGRRLHWLCQETESPQKGQFGRLQIVHRAFGDAVGSLTSVLIGIVCIMVTSGYACAARTLSAFELI